MYAGGKSAKTHSTKKTTDRITPIPMPTFGFTGPGYLSQAKVADAERSINLYVELAGRGAHIRGGSYLVSTPGLKRFCTLPTAPVRALFAGDNRQFAIGGSKLYEFFYDGTVSPAIGDCNAGPGPAEIYSNTPQSPAAGSQLFVVSGNQGYITDGSRAPGDQLRPVIPASHGAYLDGYFLAQEPNSNRFFVSNLLDGNIWNPLDFGVKIGGPDRTARIFADHEEIWLIGFRSTEPWYNSGAGNFPFAKIQGAFIEQGLTAPNSLSKLDNSIFWLGGDDRGAGIVWRMQGYTPVRVSNHAVEWAIQRYPTITDAVAVTRQYLGHSLYELHFPSADACWVYDVATDMWHERLRWSAPENQWHEHPCRTHAYGNFPTAVVGESSGQHFVGDYRNGNIYTESADWLDNDGEPKRWLRSSPHILDELRFMHHEKLIIDMQMGGSETIHCPFLAAGNDPKAMLRVSDNGGYSWSELERWASAGRLGEYQGRYRVIFRQLGRSADRAYELSGSDPIQIAIVDADLTVS